MTSVSWHWKIILRLLGVLSFLCFHGYAAFPVGMQCYVWIHGELAYNDILALRDSTTLGILAELSRCCGFALLLLLPAFVLACIAAVASSRRT